MKKSIKSMVLGLCLLAFLFSGCTQVAITGRKQFNIVPDSLMNSMSFQSYSEFIADSNLSSNAEQKEMVSRVGQRIAKAVEEYCSQNGYSHLVADYAWEFNLVEDPAVNAWAMPGGKVVVYTGLLPIAQDDAGLAVVMGHEIAHAFAKHGAERMSHGLMVEMGGIALSTALENQPSATQELFMQSYGVGTQVGVLLPYSRKHESEADHLGLIFMAMAGYKPEAAVGFWERMAASKEGQAPPELLSTHPADERRINDIKQLLPEAMLYFRPQP